MKRELTDYQKSLERSALSKNTVKVYLTAVYTYYNIYKVISPKNLEVYQDTLHRRERLTALWDLRPYAD